MEVQTRSRVASLALSEDGKLLAVSEPGSNCVSIWDVVAGKQTATIDTPAPGALLWRGERLFVAGGGPEVTAFNTAKNWQRDAIYKLPAQSVQQLSAAGGKFFDGKILGLSGTQSLLIDSVGGQVKKLYERDKLGAIAISYDGKQAIEQFNVGGTPSGYPSFCDYPAYISGKSREYRNQQYKSLGVLRQARPGPIWFDDEGLMTCQPLPIERNRDGEPGCVELNSLTADLPRSLPHEWGYVVPDALHPIFYVIGEDTISWRLADATLAKLGSRTFHLPAALERLNKMGDFISVSAHFPARLPVAASIEDQLYLYTLTHEGALYRYHTDMKPTVPAPATAIGLPAKVVEGQPITCHLFAQDPGGATFTVLKGSSLIRISPQGLLEWTPRREDVGTMEVKIRCERGADDVSFLRYTVEIVSADLASRTAGDKQASHSLGRHYVLNEAYFMTPGFDRRSLLLLDGQTLRVLDADGLAVTAQLQLPQPYQRILPRKDWFIGVNEKTIDVIDLKTLTIRHHIAVDCDTILDVTLHPSRNETYLAVTANEKSTLGRPLSRVIAINEEAGTSAMVPGVFANRIAVDASGQFAYVVLRHPEDVVWRKDWIFPDRDAIHAAGGVPPTNTLIVYDISTGDWKYVDANLNALDRTAQESDPSMHLVLSADRALVALVSSGGIDHGKIPAYSTRNIHNALSSFPARSPHSFEFHPALDLVATTDSTGVHVFSRETALPAERRLDLDQELQSPGRLSFAPGGQHLLVDCLDADGRRLIRAIPLRLEADERKVLLAFNAGGGRPVVTSIAAPIATEPAAVDLAADLTALEALHGKLGPSLSPKEIAKRSRSAIVIVESRDGFGTGFFVGSKGYILTCAHVLPKVGNPSIILNSNDGPNANSSKIPAVVLGTDRELDLALLKAELKFPAPFVHLAGGEVEAGEAVTVIGNPGLGGMVLDFTVTTGIVSNAKRTLFQKSYLQTTAAVNPGNSGGPVFNSHGDVIGIAVLKANIENTAFAIPADVAIAFLKRAAKKGD